MAENTVAVVRLTQILKDEGWNIIDGGYNTIHEVENKSTDEKITFTNNEEFLVWLSEKGKEWAIEL